MTAAVTAAPPALPMPTPTGLPAGSTVADPTAAGSPFAALLAVATPGTTADRPPEPSSGDGPVGSLGGPLGTDDPSDGQPDLREAFDDFIGQTFFGQILAQMRKSVAENPYFGGGPGQAAFQGQLDTVLVERIADAAGESFSEPLWRNFTARR